MHHVTGWAVGIRSGSFTPYLQVALGNTTRVVSVTVEQDVASTCLVTALEIKYSDDAVVWETLGYTVSGRYIGNTS